MLELGQVGVEQVVRVVAEQGQLVVEELERVVVVVLEWKNLEMVFLAAQEHR